MQRHPSSIIQVLDRMSAAECTPFKTASKIRLLEELYKSHSYSNTGKESESLDHYLHAEYSNGHLWGTI